MSQTAVRRPNMDRKYEDRDPVALQVHTLQLLPAATFPMPQVTSSHVHPSTSPSREHSCMYVQVYK